MACGLPAIAVAAHGPSEIVEDGQTGWLVPPDDEEALAAALVMAVNDAHERRRRGTPTSAADVALPRMPPCARATVGQSWERSWPSSTKRCSVCLPSP